MKSSKIEWTDHTFNPWIGCDKVAPECLHCYAEAQQDHRYGRVQWGKGKERSRTSPDYWKQPGRWDKQAAATGTRPRVFCASLADWLDDEAPIEWLAELLCTIVLTPHLDWLLLSKRVQDWESRMQAVAELKSDDFLLSSAPAIAKSWLSGIHHHNVWLGASAGCQETANRMVPALVKIPATTRFLSCEPLLGIIDFTNLPLEEINWVILGGESGKGARVCDAAWMRRIISQCGDRNVPVFVKQLGENFKDGDYPEHDYSHLKGKNDDFDAFPWEFKIRQSPQPRAAVTV